MYRDKLITSRKDFKMAAKSGFPFFFLNHAVQPNTLSSSPADYHTIVHLLFSDRPTSTKVGIHIH